MHRMHADRINRTRRRGKCNDANQEFRGQFTQLTRALCDTSFAFYDAVVRSTRDESVMLMAQGRAELALGDIQYHLKT